MYCRGRDAKRIIIDVQVGVGVVCVFVRRRGIGGFYVVAKEIA